MPRAMQTASITKRGDMRTVTTVGHHSVSTWMPKASVRVRGKLGPHELLIGLSNGTAILENSEGGVGKKRKIVLSLLTC